MRSTISYSRLTLSPHTALTGDSLPPAASCLGVPSPEREMSWFKVFTLSVLEEQRNFLRGSSDPYMGVRLVSSKTSVGRGSTMDGVVSPQKDDDCEPI